jgi:hypothetical protein
MRQNEEREKLLKDIADLYKSSFDGPTPSKHLQPKSSGNKLTQF